MDDLISKKALLETYDKVHQGPPGRARKLIEEAPDAIVRCKDCRWGDWSRNEKGEKMILCYNGDTGIEDGYLHKPDWFCAERENKGGDAQ